MQEALRTQNTERVSREPKVKVVVAIEEIERKREEKLQVCFMCCMATLSPRG